MPSSLSQDKVECVKVKLAFGLPANVIAKQTNVSLHSVYRICRNIVLSGCHKGEDYGLQGKTIDGWWGFTVKRQIEVGRNDELQAK